MDSPSIDKTKGNDRLSHIPDPDVHEPESPEPSPPPKEAPRLDSKSPTYQSPIPDRRRSPSPPLYIPSPVIHPTQPDDPDKDFEIDDEYGKGKKGKAKQDEPTNEWDDADEILKESAVIRSQGIKGQSGLGQMHDVVFSDNSPAANHTNENSPKANADQTERSTKKGRSASASKKPNRDQTESADAGTGNEHYIMGKEAFDPNKFRKANQNHHTAAEDIFRYPTYGSYMLKPKEGDTAQTSPQGKDTSFAPLASSSVPHPVAPSSQYVSPTQPPRAHLTYEDENLLDDILESNRSH
eukprot:TRINITY_DN721_c0_g1_i16.p1 TRINITY_DN721_c0_g1~~TRINITY_DN721_c0_g1_i16.p1  ORF type:complete len:296 (-),score=49.13 TRINITY_DN721_c0_g1_i16:632-1519(-)